ncbi:MAG TPA: cell division FtsA domain-containing protein, partial [Gemmatimonadaceae bacterium]
KERYGCAYEPMVSPEDIVELPSTVAQGERHIPREVLAHIIHQRIDEIFSLVHAEIQRAGFANRLSGGIVVTGGAAAMQGVAELATDVFGTGVRIGIPDRNVGGLADSVEAPRFSTVVGLALYGANRLAISGASAGGRRRAISSPNVDRFAQRVKTWLQDFF